MDYFMLNWTDKPIPPENMMVARKVAILMATSVIEEEVVDFTHELCDGRVYRGEDGVYVSVGGIYFQVDFGTERGQSCEASFFIPRRSLHQKLGADELIFVQTFSAKTGDPVGYPDDVDMAAVLGGKLRLKRINKGKKNK